MIDDDTGVVDDDPHGLDDGAMGGPEAWAAVVANLTGEGPGAPPCEPIKRLSGIEARLDEFGWQVRPCSTGGYFAWCPTGTQYCATWRELGAFASKVKYAAVVAARKAAAEVKKPTEPTPVMSRSEQKNAARDRRVQLKNCFMDTLARVLAKAMARRDVDQQAES